VTFFDVAQIDTAVQAFHKAIDLTTRSRTDRETAYWKSAFAPKLRGSLDEGRR